jgi:hypothetical protein
VKSVRRWVIVGHYGLYTGQCLLRVAAIREHVEAIYGVRDKQPMNAPLSEEERALWEKCMNKGDRAVTATITYEEQPWLTSVSPSSESEPTPSQNQSPTT